MVDILRITYSKTFSLLNILYSAWYFIEVWFHDEVIKWRHFQRDWPFVRGIHRSPVNSPHKGQWHGALMFSLISVWINGWVNNREAGDLRHHPAHYEVSVMRSCVLKQWWLGDTCIHYSGLMTKLEGDISLASIIIHILYKWCIFCKMLMIDVWCW